MENPIPAEFWERSCSDAEINDVAAPKQTKGRLQPTLTIVYVGPTSRPRPALTGVMGSLQVRRSFRKCGVYFARDAVGNRALTLSSTICRACWYSNSFETRAFEARMSLQYHPTMSSPLYFSGSSLRRNICAHSRQRLPSWLNHQRPAYCISGEYCDADGIGFRPAIYFPNVLQIHDLFAAIIGYQERYQWEENIFEGTDWKV